MTPPVKGDPILIGIKKYRVWKVTGQAYECHAINDKISPRIAMVYLREISWINDKFVVKE